MEIVSGEGYGIEVVTIVIAILFAIVFSNVLSHVFPRLPLTLIQIGIGILLGLTSLDKTLELEPEIFMVMVIAPLLYREAEETDLSSLWHVKRQVFLMAFLLVFIVVGAVGFSVHRMIPALPLAACFALGAILGPTDVVAVSSLSSRIKIDSKLMNVLLGEGLINDASGLTAFHFAVAALLTGAFSAVDAAGQLLIVSLGGFLVGYVLVSVKRSVTSSLRALSVTNTATFVLIEILMPFLCYIVAELFGVSGVLAAVMAGTRQSLDLKKTAMFEAELAHSTHSLWEVITFTLNSFVFILLGLQFPSVVSHIWTNTAYSHSFLILASALVTAILLVVRFLSVFFIASGVLGSSGREKIKSALILTLSGVKGAVSLATAFALPFVLSNGSIFEERPLLMFITGGTIIISLVVALVALPLLADEPEDHDPTGELKLELLEETVRQLGEQAVTPEDREQLAPVIANYRRRIREHRHLISGKDRRKEARALHAVTFSVEFASLKQYYRDKKIRPQTYLDYLDLISTMYRRDLYGFFAHTLSRLERFRWAAKRFLLPKRRTPRKKWVQEHRKNLQLIFSNNTDAVVQALDSLRGRYSEDLINLLIDERIDLTDQLIDSVYGALHRHAQMHQNHSSSDDLRGYYIERRVIHQFLEQGKISEEQANTFRIDVNKLESFTLAHNRSSVVLKFMTLTGLE